MSASPIVDRWIVLKFGGTSVSRRHRWNTIGELAKKRAEETGGRVLVVVSALSGVTNELTAIADGAADSTERVAKLEARHRDFLAELDLDDPFARGLAEGQRVAEAVAELSYIPNHLASALASTRTNIVGAIVPSSRSPGPRAE